MRIELRPFFRSGPILLGFTLFGLMWMVMWELDFRDRYYRGLTGDHSYPGLYYEHVFVAFLLFLASVALIYRRLWSCVLSVLFCSVVAWDSMFSFWKLSDWAELPRFSYSHFETWFRSDGDTVFRFILAGVIFVLSVLAFIRLASSRDKPNHV